MRLRWTMMGLAGLIGLSITQPAAGQRAGFWQQTFNRVTGENSCRLNPPAGGIRHVVFMQFDNVHFFRDRPNIPSDLEQMPSLLGFFTGNGVLMSTHFTDEIAHTATNFLSSATGLYPDRMGMPVSNSYRYFKPDGTTSVGVSFGYWTAPLFDPTNANPTDKTPLMVNENGVTAPAPWVPFTRAGCDVGEDGGTNAVLENTTGDVATLFGATSPQATQVATNPAQAAADLVGIAVHCAQGSAVCLSGNARPDLLPNEPGGYAGFQALYGHANVAPQLTSSLPLTDLNGVPIGDTTGHLGFPGFDGMTAPVSLSYAAQMLERGIPVVQVYLSDAHEKHPGSGSSYGPGEAGYVQQLKAYDAAFAQFFARLKAGGIDQSNTLFILSSDENDRFVGGAGSPANCDGVTTPCTYAQIGEVNADLPRLLATQRKNTTPFGIHSDMAPVFWVTGNPGPLDPTLRQLEKDVGALTAVSPLTGNTDALTQALLDPSAMNFMHMITADPARNANFVMYANPDYFLFSSGRTTDCAQSPACITEPPGFAWNHGGLVSQVTQTFVAFAGPGVRQGGVDSVTWSDHVDIRPTMLALVGLVDDYVSDGRVITEALSDNVLPPSVRANRALFQQLGSLFKQINAPLGQLAVNVVVPSITGAMLGSDASFSAASASINGLTQRRNALAAQMKAVLNGAMFNGQNFDANLATQLIGQAQQLLGSTVATQ